MFTSSIYSSIYCRQEANEAATFPRLAVITAIITQIVLLAATLALYFKGVGMIPTAGVLSSMLLPEVGLALYLSCKAKKTTEEIPTSFASSIEQLHDKAIKKQVSGVYALSNESGIETSIQTIENSPSDQTKPKCHIGVGALHNFDIMAARRSDCGVIFDFNPENRKFIKQCLTFVQESDSPKAFVEKVCSYMEQDIKQYNHYQGYDSPLQRMQHELGRPSSWLYQKDATGRFEHIKRLAEEGKIVAITQDFCNNQVFQNLTEKIEQFGYGIDTLYLSNLYAYIPIDSFHATFDVLTASQPLVIHCRPPDSCPCQKGCQCPKVQNISRTWEKTDKVEGALKPKVC